MWREHRQLYRLRDIPDFPVKFGIYGKRRPHNCREILNQRMRRDDTFTAQSECGSQLGRSVRSERPIASLMLHY